MLLLLLLPLNRIPVNFAKVVALPKPRLKESETVLKQYHVKDPWSGLLPRQIRSLSYLESCPLVFAEKMEAIFLKIPTISMQGCLSLVSAPLFLVTENDLVGVFFGGWVTFINRLRFLNAHVDLQTRHMLIVIETARGTNTLALSLFDLHVRV